MLKSIIIVTESIVTNLLLLGLSCLVHEHDVCPGVLGEGDAGGALENAVLAVDTEQKESGEEDLSQWDQLDPVLGVLAKKGRDSIRFSDIIF